MDVGTLRKLWSWNMIDYSQFHQPTCFQPDFHSIALRIASPPIPTSVCASSNNCWPHTSVRIVQSLYSIHFSSAECDTMYCLALCTVCTAQATLCTLLLRCQLICQLSICAPCPLPHTLHNLLKEECTFFLFSHFNRSTSNSVYGAARQDPLTTSWYRPLWNFGNQSSKSVGHNFQKIYHVPCSTDAI